MQTLKCLNNVGSSFLKLLVKKQFNFTVALEILKANLESFVSSNQCKCAVTIKTIIIQSYISCINI